MSPILLWANAYCQCWRVHAGACESAGPWCIAFVARRDLFVMAAAVIDDFGDLAPVGAWK